MCRCRIDEQSIIVNLCTVSINKVLVTEFVTVKKIRESKFDGKCVNTAKSTTYQIPVFKNNQMFGITHSKTNAKDHREQNK